MASSDQEAEAHGEKGLGGHVGEALKGDEAAEWTNPPDETEKELPTGSTPDGTIPEEKTEKVESRTTEDPEYEAKDITTRDSTEEEPLGWQEGDTEGLSDKPLEVGTGDMKVVFDKLTLQAMVTKVSGVTGTPASNDILKHVLVQAHSGGVAMVGTDMELSAIARSAEPKVETEGVIVLPIKMLGSIADLAGDIVTMDVKEGLARFISDDTVWQLNSVAHDLFPEVPRATDNARPISTSQLLRALEIVFPAVGRDESRPALLMVHFDALGVYATDGARAHFAALPSDFENLHIPAPAVRPLINLLKNTPEDYVYIDETAAHILFLIGPDEFATRMMDAQFPSVRGSMIDPRLKTHTEELVFSRERMRLALKRAAAISDDGAGSVTLKLNSEGACHITTSNMKGNRVATLLEIDYKGQPRSVTYLIPSILDLMNSFTDEMLTVKLSPSASEGVLLAHSEEATVVILPRVRAS